MLWTDINKFLIVSDKLLEREILCSQAQSMLIYILAHTKNIYAPLRDDLQIKMIEKARRTLALEPQFEDQSSAVVSFTELKTDDDSIQEWRIKGHNSVQRRKCFVDLGLRHSMETFKWMDADNSAELAEKLIKNRQFSLYNRQFQMVYYGDLSISGEDKMRPLNPGVDTINKGFDFHNTYNYLCTKLNLDNDYPLREFDLFTLCDLINSRLVNKDNVLADRNLDTFFNRKSLRKQATRVLSQVINLLNKYLENKNIQDEGVCRTFDGYRKNYENKLNELGEDEGETPDPL